MKKIVYLFVGIFFCYLMVSCDSKQDPINELNNLAEEIEANGNNYTEEDWNNISNEIEEIDSELEKYQYTDEEQKEIGRLKAKLSYDIAIKYGTKKAKQLFNQAFGAADFFSDESK